MQTIEVLSGLVSCTLVVAAIIFCFVVLVTLRRIRLEAITINMRLRTVNTILRKVHAEVLPPKECRRCLKLAQYGQNKCAHCGAELSW